MKKEEYKLKKITIGAIISEPGSSIKYKTGSWRSYKPILTEFTPPCTRECPARIKVREYISLIKEKHFEEAYKLLKDKIPFPVTIGRVCHHPCEKKCYRGQFDEPIAINILKRFIADYALKNKKKPSKVEITKKEKIAIIGSGPAGLSAAYKLVKMGYSVTVFEALPVAGGIPRFGIPDYRLPKNVLETEIDDIKSLGVEIKLNTSITDIKHLRKQYEAVFIAVGVQKSRKLNVPGEELDGVICGLEFLKSLNLEKKVSLGKKVIVIGGGNVATDVARSALRLGAETFIVYRRSRKEMPAIKEGVEEAEREGVQIKYLASPKKILGTNKVSGIECVRMKLGEPDESGRKRPIPIEGSEFVIEADTIILAIGEYPDFSFLKGSVKTEKQRIVVDPKSLATDQPGVFAGGDVVTGPATVIEAIAQGTKAAVCIDRYLRGEPMKYGEEALPLIELEKMNLSMVETKSRIKSHSLPVKERMGNFKEVNLGFTEEEALEEAERCLSCGSCKLCKLCSIYCPDNAAKMGETEAEINLDYCKGCGICENECPCGVIIMELEVK